MQGKQKKNGVYQNKLKDGYNIRVSLSHPNFWVLNALIHPNIRLSGALSDMRLGALSGP